MSTSSVSKVYKSHTQLSELNGGTFLDGGHNALVPYHAAAVNPTVDDDSTAYKVGTEWINTATGAVFVCSDNTAGAAVWEYLNEPATGNWSPTQVWVDSAAAAGGDGTVLHPFATITEAMTAIGVPVDGPDAKRKFTVHIAAGQYDENVTTPVWRMLTFMCHGTVILGDGADTTYGSTTPRTLTIDNLGDGEPVGTPSRPMFCIKGISSEVTSTHSAYGAGNMIISGDLIWNQSNGNVTSHESYLCGVKVSGVVGYTGFENICVHNVILEKCFFDSTFNVPSINLNVVRSCEFDGLITCATVGRFSECEISGGLTAGVNSYYPPNGFYGCLFNGGTITATNLPVDSVTKKTIIDGAITVVGSILLVEEEGGAGGSSVSDWAATTDYLADDIVVYKGLMFRITTSHTSGAAFNENLDKVEGRQTCVQIVSQVAHGLSAREVIRLSGGSWVKAQADSETNVPSPVTVVLEAATDYFIALSGDVRVTDTGHGLTAETWYYLSDTVAGGLSTSVGTTYTVPCVWVEDANNYRVTAVPAIVTGGTGGSSLALVRTPSVVSPANTSTGAAFSSLGITGSTYYSVYGVAQKKMEVEIYSNSGLSTLVYSGETTTGTLTQHTVSSTLGQLVQYWMRIRYTDIEDVVSSWSATSTFTTTDTTVGTPSVTLPVAGNLQRDDSVSVTSSAFSSSDGGETHVSSSWKVTSDPAGSLVIDSVTESVGDLVTWTADLSGAVGASTAYFWVKHHGSLNDGAWSASVACTLTPAITTPSVTSPADSGTVVVDTTFDITTSAFASVVASDTHVSTSYQLTLATDTGFASPILNVVEDTANKTSYSYDSTGDLTDGVSYIVRCKFHSSTDASSWSAANTVTAATDAVTTPTVTSPAAASDVNNGQQFTSSAFATLLSVDTHASSDWEVRRVSDDALLQSSYDDVTNKTTWTPDLSALADGDVKVRVRHTGTSLGDSAWSDYVTYTLVSAIIFEKYVDGAAGNGFFGSSYIDHFAYDSVNNRIIASTYSGSPFKGHLNTFSSDGASLSLSKNYIYSTNNTTLGSGGVCVSDGRIITGGYIDTGTVDSSAVAMVDASTGTISAFGDTSATGTGYIRGSNSKGLVAVFCGGTPNSSDVAGTKAVIGYISDPSLNTFTVQSLYVSGEGSTSLYNCCILGDGNCVAAGYHFDTATVRAFFIRYNTSCSVLSSYKYTIGASTGYFYSVVADSTTSTDWFAVGYSASAGNGVCTLIVNGTDSTANWTQVVAHTNTTNTDEGNRIAEDATQIYVTINNATDGNWLCCLNKSTGAVVWSVRDTRATSYQIIYDVKVISGEVIVTGTPASGSLEPSVASLSPVDGSVNYVRMATYGQVTAPYQIVETSDGYAICGRYYEGGTLNVPFVIRNPHLSPDFVDITATWTYETFTCYEPSDTVTETAISWTAGTENFASVALTTTDSGYTTGDII